MAEKSKQQRETASDEAVERGQEVGVDVEAAARQQEARLNAIKNADTTVGDRVATLSLKADGTPDQHNPRIIGDKEAAKEFTRQQVREQRVSAIDDAARTALAQVDTAEGGEAPQDPTIAALADKHEQAAKNAEQDADSLVDSLTE